MQDVTNTVSGSDPLAFLDERDHVVWLQARGMNQTPKNDYHFGPGALGSELPQNTIDARLSAERPAILRYRFVKVSAQAVNKILGPARAHYEASAPRYREIFPEQGEIDALVIEDFETTGLDGPVDTMDAASGPFAAYVYNVGNSGKAEGGGSHGLGTSVLHGSSQLRTIFSYTERRDSEAYAIGQAWLKSHAIEGVSYEAYGFFADGSDGTMARPFAGSEARALAQSLGFARQPGQSGLSQVVLMPHPEITRSELIKSLVRSSLYRILDGSLVAMVDDVRLDARSIVGIVAETPDLAAETGLIELAARDVAEVEDPTFHVHFDQKIERLRTDHFDAEQLEEMRRLWSLGEVVRVALNFIIDPKGERPEAGRVDVLLRKSADGETPIQMHVRDSVSMRFAKPTSAIALTKVTDRPSPAAAFFRACENPAHDAWDLKFLREAGMDYWGARTLIEMVKHAARDLESVCAARDEGAPVDSAIDAFFQVDVAADGPSVNDPRNDGADSDLPDPSDDPDAPGGEWPTSVPTVASALEFEERPDGVALVCGDPRKLGGFLPARATFDCAYEFGDGANAHKYWRPVDFRLDEKPIHLSITGGRILNVEDNQVEMLIESTNFRFEARGFDVHRSLSSRILPDVDEENASQGEAA